MYSSTKRYYTRFSQLTLSLDKEPEQYIREALDNGWEPMRIFHELKKVAKHHKIPMVDRRTVYYWITRVKNNGNK